MNPDKIRRARDEAKRFLDKTDAAEAAFRFNRYADGDGGYFSNEDQKSTAALKRASMDLSRALSELRRGSSQ